MKSESDNFRDSSVQGIIRRLQAHKVPLQIYEPALDGDEFMACPVVQDLAAFKKSADLIVANRSTPELQDVLHKVYTRDLFGKDS